MRVELWTPKRACAGLAQWCPALIAMPRESRTCATSCGWTPASSNEIAPPRAAASSGPRTVTPGTVARPSSAYARFGVQSSSRMSSYLYTNPAEIDAFVEGLEYTRSYFKLS